VQREGVGSDDDRFAETGSRGQPIRAFGQAAQANRKRVVAHAVAVQQVHDREAASLVARVGGRKIDCRLAIGRVSFKIPFERFPVHGDVLDRPSATLRPGSPRLCIEPRRGSGRERHQARDRRQRPHDHPASNSTGDFSPKRHADDAAAAWLRG
jgi:hypothetical protein